MNNFDMNFTGTLLCWTVERTKAIHFLLMTQVWYTYVTDLRIGRTLYIPLLPYYAFKKLCQFSRAIAVASCGVSEFSLVMACLLYTSDAADE